VYTYIYILYIYIYDEVKYVLYIYVYRIGLYEREKRHLFIHVYMYAEEELAPQQEPRRRSCHLIGDLPNTTDKQVSRKGFQVSILSVLFQPVPHKQSGL
jgi:hypothetical protein